MRCCKLTGERKYLDAAMHYASRLASHVRLGDTQHTPWPFRVHARTGVTLALEEYGGNVDAFRKARDIAWRWMVDHPLNRESPAWNKWSAYLEDVPRHIDDVNQLTFMAAAYCILARQVSRLRDRVKFRLGRGPFFGAQAIGEQSTPDATFGCCSRAGQGDHTARWAAISVMYFEKICDGQAREDALRGLNYGAYFAASDGRMACCGLEYRAPYWLNDGYSDYLRHFTAVQTVKYGEHSLQHRVFGVAATSTITAGGTALAEDGSVKPEAYTLRPLTGGAADAACELRRNRNQRLSDEYEPLL